MSSSARELLDEVALDNRALLYRCRHDDAALTSVLPALLEVLADPDPEHRRAALAALVVIGPAASTALEAISPLVHDDDQTVRANAVAAIGRVCLDDPKAALPLLRRAADDETLIDQVLLACTTFGVGSRELSDVFVRAYRSGDAKRRRLATRCLVRSNAPDADAERCLEAARTDGDARVRKAARAKLVDPPAKRSR